MYVYLINYTNYDDYAFTHLASEKEYTKKELLDILYYLIEKVYELEDFPDLPCLIDWGDVIYYINKKEYRKILKEEFGLLPLKFDVNMYFDDKPDLEKVKNVKCTYSSGELSKECLRTTPCKWRQ